MKLKRLMALCLGIVLIVFFTAPSFLFGEPGDNSTAEGPDNGQYEMDPNDADYSDEPEEAPAGEEMDVYCVDEDVTLTDATDAYSETGTDVSDELQANGVDEVNAEAAEIMATTATGATDGQNQDAVWDIIDNNVDYTPNDDVEEVVLAVMTMADGFVALPENNDTDPSNDVSLQEYLDDENVNEVEVALDADTLVDENGDYNEFEATATMENPLVPGITDEGKTVSWYVLLGSYNVSFSQTDLVLETTSTMYDYEDDNDGSNAEDTDGDGAITDDNYGFASIPYYFYWWGEGYSEFEEMSVNIGACLDIDEDGEIDKEQGEDLDEFNSNMNVIQTIENPDYDDTEDPGSYNSPHIVATDVNGDVITENPDNVDIDYFNAGKMVVTEKQGQDGIYGTYEDVWIGTYWTQETGIVWSHWENGAPSVTKPAGYYFEDREWHDEEITYPEAYDQRFVIESYSEPCDDDSGTYTAWGSFELNKTDSETQGPVEGAVYKLTYIGGQTFTPDVTEYTLTTDVDGNAFIDGLPWGTYSLTEESAPPGYAVDTATYTVYIGGTALFMTGGALNAVEDIVDCPLGSITVTKTGLEGDDEANLSLYDSSDNLIATSPQTVSNGGLASWIDLPYGGYYIVEDFNGITNVYTYTVSNPVADITVNGDETDTITNTAEMGSITVTKMGLKGNDQANLSLYDSSDNLIATSPQTVSNGGLASWIDLPYGGYYIVEDFNGITNVYTYTVSNPVANITVDGDETDTITNTAEMGDLTVHKTGLEGSDRATFTLTGPGGVSYGGASIWNHGSIHWQQLPYGSYTLTETYPSGNVYTYTTDLSSDPIIIGPDNTWPTIEVVNTAEKGSITVTKTGLEGNDQANLSLYDSSDNLIATSPQIVSNGGTASWIDLPYGDYYILEDFNGITNVYTYTVSNPVANITVDGDETDTITNTAEKGSISVHKTGLEESDQAIFSLSGPGGPYTDITLSEGGTGGWIDLPFGSYTLTESYPSGNVFTYTTDLSSDPVVIGPDNENPTVEVVNTAEKGSITVTKIGLEGDDEANLSLYDSSDNLIATSPQTVSNGGTASWIDLPYGDYYILEDFNGITNLYTYTVSNPVWSGTIEGDIGAEVPVVIENCAEKGSIEIFKTDAVTGLPLGGSTFELYREGSWILVDTQILGPDGHYKWIDLPYGTYKVVEASAPAGYLLFGNPPIGEFVFGLNSETPNVILTQEIADPRIPGDITLNKSGLDYDDTAGFTLYDSSNNPVGGEKTVTGNGSVVWTDLEWDTYSIKETTTPSGYNTIADITGIVIDSRNEGQQSYTFDRENTKKVSYRGSVTLTKSGLDSTDVAGFTLYDSNGAAVGGEKKITGNGTVSWGNLPFGTYRIVETTVPSGYSKMSDITGIEVNSAKRNHSFSRTNSKTPPDGGIEVLGITELPFTGMNPAIPISGVSIILGGLAMFIASLKKKFRRK